MEQITIHAKLVAKQTDGMGYTNYVFEDIESKDNDFKYVMCVRFPNWEQGPINLNDIGYLNLRYVISIKISQEDSDEESSKGFFRKRKDD